MRALSDIQDEWLVSQFDGTYVDAKEHSSRLIAYKQTRKRNLVIEKQEIATLFGNVQTKLRTYRLREYVPPQGLALTVSV
jgi:tmRNA-binding protein